MITNYHRPTTLEEALTLLSQPNTLPLGGGTLLSHVGVRLSLLSTCKHLVSTTSKKRATIWKLVRLFTLQQLLESGHCPEALKTAIRLEVPINLRNSATVAGTLVTCDGRSPFACALLGLDARSTFEPPLPMPNLNIGEFLPLRPRGLITPDSIPLNVKFAFETIARTPSDKPIVCLALAQWGKGRARLAVGGWGRSPTLAMDGTETDGLETAARNACHESTDEWASAEYRMDVAATLAKRCLDAIAERKLA